MQLAYVFIPKSEKFHTHIKQQAKFVTCRWYKCYAQLVFPKRGMCLVFPKRGRCYMGMLQILRTSVKCLLSAGVLGYWLVAGVLGSWLFSGVIGYWEVLVSQAGDFTYRSGLPDFQFESEFSGLGDMQLKTKHNCSTIIHNTCQ